MLVAWPAGRASAQSAGAPKAAPSQSSPSSPASAAAALESLKTQYLNQKIVIAGTTVTSTTALLTLSEWRIAKVAADGRYLPDGSAHAPASDRGKTGTVIAVQPADPTSTPPAAAEPRSNPASPGAFFDIFVKLDTGRVLMTTISPEAVSSIQAASASLAASKAISARVAALVGKPLYPVSYSRLFTLDATLADMQSTEATDKQVPTSALPLLDPLVITAARYLPAEDAVVLKLRLPPSVSKDAEIMSFTPGVLQKAQKAGKDATLLDLVAGSLLPSVPKSLTPDELKAIRSGTIARGMSRQALYYSQGMPKEENDYGSGVKQLIYSPQLIVYVGNDDKVVDWQSFNF